MASSSYMAMQTSMSSRNFETRPDRIAAFSADEFLRWIATIATEPLAMRTKIYDARWSISECTCPGNRDWGLYGGPHSRTNPLMLRDKLETATEQVCEGSGSAEGITLLSIGSGQLYQELVILARLWMKGHRQIHLYSVENDSDNGQENLAARAYFSKLIDLFNQHGANFSFTHVQSIQEIPATVRFDVAYAVDFDDAQGAFFVEYADRGIPAGISGQKGDANYELIRLLLNAANRLKDNANALFWLSSGQLVHAFRRESVLHPERRYFDFTLREDMCPVYWYINANPFFVLYYLHQLQDTECPVIINETILDDDMKWQIESLLLRYGLQNKVRILPESEARRILDTGMTLVLDGTLADETKGVDLVDEHVFFAKGSFVVRRSLEDCKTMCGRSTDSRIPVYPASLSEMLVFEFFHHVHALPPERKMQIISDFLSSPSTTITENLGLIRSIPTETLHAGLAEQVQEGIYRKVLDSLPSWLSRTGHTLTEALNEQYQTRILDQRIEDLRQTGQHRDAVIRLLSSSPALLVQTLEMIPAGERLDLFLACRGSVLEKDPENLKRVLELIPPEQRYDALTVEFPGKCSFSGRFLLRGESNPELLSVLFSLLPEPRKLDLFCDVVVNRVAPDVLLQALQCITPSQQMAAIHKPYGKSPGLLYLFPNDPQFQKAILDMLPAENRLAAADVRDDRGNTLLHLSAENVEAFQQILALYPPEGQRDAVRQQNHDGYSVLYCARFCLASLRMILALYPDSERYDAVMATNIHGKTMMESMPSNHAMRRVILEMLPAADRRKALTGTSVITEFSEGWFTILEFFQDNELPDVLMLRDSAGNTLLHAIAKHTPALLLDMLGRLSPEERLCALGAEGNGHFTVLQIIANTQPEIFESILNLLENRAYEALTGGKPGACPVLFFGAHHVSVLKNILECYSQHASAVAPTQLWHDVTWRHPDKYGLTLLQHVARRPQSLQMILDHLPGSRCLDALKVLDYKGSSVLHFAAQCPESLDMVLRMYPEQERLAAVMLPNEYAISALDMAKQMPASLLAILRLLPEDQRHTALMAVDKDGISVLATVKEKWPSMDELHALVPELPEEFSPALSAS